MDRQAAVERSPEPTGSGCVIDDRHWLIWARNCRQQYPGGLGYYSQQAWYVPPECRGYLPDGEPETTEHDIVGTVTRLDEQIAHEIGRSLFRLEKGSPYVAMAVRAIWRAYRPKKGKYPTIVEVAKEFGVSDDTVRRWAKDGRGWVEGNIDNACGILYK